MLSSGRSSSSSIASSDSSSRTPSATVSGGSSSRISSRTRIVDLVQGGEVEVAAGEFDQARAKLGIQRLDQVAEVGLVQFADQRAQERSVAAFDAGGDLGDEGFAHRAVLIAHRHAREKGFALGRRVSGGLVSIIGHETPHLALNYVPAPP